MNQNLKLIAKYPSLFSIAVFSKKYYLYFNSIQAQSINRLLQTKNFKPLSITLKDFSIYDENSEYLKEFYPTQSISPIYALFLEFYSEYKELLKIPYLLIQGELKNILHKRNTKMQKYQQDVNKNVNTSDDTQIVDKQILYSIDSEQKEKSQIPNGKSNQLLSNKDLDNSFSNKSSYCSTIFNIYQKTPEKLRKNETTTKLNQPLIENCQIFKHKEIDQIMSKEIAELLIFKENRNSRIVKEKEIKKKKEKKQNQKSKDQINLNKFKKVIQMPRFPEYFQKLRLQEQSQQNLSSATLESSLIFRSDSNESYLFKPNKKPIEYLRKIKTNLNKKGYRSSITDRISVSPSNSNMNSFDLFKNKQEESKLSYFIQKLSSNSSSQKPIYQKSLEPIKEQQFKKQKIKGTLGKRIQLNNLKNVNYCELYYNQTKLPSLQKKTIEQSQTLPFTSLKNNKLKNQLHNVKPYSQQQENSLVLKTKEMRVKFPMLEMSENSKLFMKQPLNSQLNKMKKQKQTQFSIKKSLSPQIQTPHSHIMSLDPKITKK